MFKECELNLIKLCMFFLGLIWEDEEKMLNLLFLKRVVVSVV